MKMGSHAHSSKHLIWKLSEQILNKFHIKYEVKVKQNQFCSVSVLTLLYMTSITVHEISQNNPT